jgi:N-acetyl-gamma-glutamylphosphate reductase
LPDTLWVKGSASAMLSYEVDPRSSTVLAMCVIDNLAKGASAQAIQALNVSRGWPEDLGLARLGQFP